MDASSDRDWAADVVAGRISKRHWAAAVVAHNWRLRTRLPRLAAYAEANSDRLGLGWSDADEPPGAFRP